MLGRNIKVMMHNRYLALRLIALVDGVKKCPLRSSEASLVTQAGDTTIQFIIDDRAPTRFGAVGRVFRSVEMDLAELPERVELTIHDGQIAVEPTGCGAKP